MSRADEIRSALRSAYLYVDVASMFSGLKTDIESLCVLLSSLPRTETQFECCRASMVLAGLGDEDPLDRQRTLVSSLLTQPDIDLLNRLQDEKEKQFAPFFRGQLLELLRWASLFCPAPKSSFKSFESADVRRRFAAAAFISGHLLMERVGQSNLVVPDTQRLFPAEALPYVVASVYAGSTATQPKRVLGRGIELLGSYYKRYDPDLDEKLQRSVGLTLDEYLLCLGFLVPTFLWMGRSGTFIDLTKAASEQPRFQAVFERFARHESQTGNELALALWGNTKAQEHTSNTAWSTKPLRERPILRDSWERATIIDARFWEEKSAVGPLFLIIRDAPSRSVTQHVLGAFGKAFEDYACDILERMLRAEWEDGFTGFARQLKGRDPVEGEYEIDAVYRCRKQLLAFEVKATFLREDRFGDPERFLEHLDEKYVLRDKDGSETARALEQLVRICRVVASGNPLACGFDTTQIQLIHPILITYDAVLSAPKVGEYLAERFMELLEPEDVLPSGQVWKGRVRVAPLIVLTANDIENLEDSVVNFRFTQLLFEYEKECETRFLSLHDYIAISRYKDMLEPNNRLAQNAKGVLEEIALQAFGKDIRDDE